jgi:tRNA dimethylallyltransferase
VEPPVVAVVGPTAVGKSELGLALARELGGEVVNADSMQLYRGMDVGTAKLTEAEQGDVVHHVLDVWDLTDDANVADYQRMARAAFVAARLRGARPVLVGGSGLYVRAALDRLDFPGTDPAVRRRLEAELDDEGPARLHRLLAEVDPAAAAAILPTNGRRLVRALEVVELTGRPFTASLPEHVYEVPAVQVGLTLPRPELDDRIARRVDLMWERGLVEEVRRLVDAGLPAGRTASRALGYAQVLRHLAGEWTEQQAHDETVRATRRFARRQESWFRRDPRVVWILAADPDLLARALAVVGAAGRP